jgi:hypothetical protein
MAGRGRQSAGLTIGPLVVILLVSIALTHVAWAVTTERASVSSAGAEGNGNSAGWYQHISISADGRFVAFASDASNLVLGDTNGARDVFVHDRLTRTTECISVAGSGEPAGGYFPSINADGRFVAFCSGGRVHVRDRLTGTTESVGDPWAGCDAPSISADGRFVAFERWWCEEIPDRFTICSCAIMIRDRQTGTLELVGSGTSPAVSADGRFVAFEQGASWLSGSYNNIFVRDRMQQTTERVSVSGTGEPANGGCENPSVSADGRFVAFHSVANNLVPGDTNNTSDVFVRDRETGTTERVSVNSAGEQGDWESAWAWISADGKCVAFWSRANNLVPHDTSGPDIFVYDRDAGTIERVNVSNSWEQDNYGAAYFSHPSISGDGQVVSFASRGANLVPGDTNNADDVFVRDRAIVIPPVPSPPGLSINGGDPCTWQHSVSLWVTCGGWPEVRFRNYPGDWSPWEPCAATRPWTLSPGEGSKLVCVQGRDGQMLLSGEGCDEILFDTTGPTAGSIHINYEGATCTESHNVGLRLAATDASFMRFRNEQWAWGAFEPFAPTKAWTLSPGRGLKTVSFQCSDLCGRGSAILQASIRIAAFDDVGCYSPVFSYVEAMLRQSITGGCSSAPPLYCPSDPVTRAQMAVFLCRAAGKGPLNRETPTFCDVPKTHPYYGWMERLADRDSWNGNPPTIGCVALPCKRFCPSSAVLRDEMAAFLVRATGKAPMPSCSGIFADVSPGSWACPYIERVADPASWPGQVAVTSGCGCPSSAPPGARCYCPKSNVTRGQMAIFLVRAFNIPM